MIRRAPREAAGRAHDLVVIGGGIQGAMAALEAARRGYRPLLLERDDFGGATSWNHLRILHGGLRYLQTADLRRFRESVAERRWLGGQFPDLVRPLPCLMPLYGQGTRRPLILRAALALNDLLSLDRNRDVAPAARLPSGRVLGADEVAERFPTVRREGLRGGALWYDASLERPQRLVIEALRWACAAGAECLNYVEATGLELRDGRVAAVEAVDGPTGDALRFPAPTVLNCAGPWSRSLARAFHADFPALFRPSLAFNVLLDRPPPSDAAVAVEPGTPDGRTYFLRPWHGRTLAGTYHAPRRSGPSAEPSPTRSTDPRPEELDAFLDDLRLAVPRLALGREHVVRTYAGLLPAASEGSAELTSREVIVDHGREGGPEGLVSVSGVKLTTARAVAERALRVALGPAGLEPYREGAGRPEPAAPPAARELLEHIAEDPHAAASRLRALAEEEAVVHPEDLLWRRTDWSEHPSFEALLERVPPLLEPTAQARRSPCPRS